MIFVFSCKETCPGDSQKYTELVRHETLRVAVCGMLENECSLTIPQELRTIMEKTFLQFYDQYTDTVKKHMHMDSQPMLVSFLVGDFCVYKSKIIGFKDPFTRIQSTYQYKEISKRLNALYDTLSRKYSDLLPELQSNSTEEEALSDEDSTGSGASCK